MKTIALTIAAILALAFASPAQASGLTASPSPVTTLSVPVDGASTLTSDYRVKRLAVTNPDVLEARLLGANEIYVAGIAPGSCSLSIWDENMVKRETVKITVVPDLDELRSLIWQMLPSEKAIKVVSIEDKVAVTGTASSIDAQNVALKIAETWAPGRVVNMLRVGGIHQVILDVRIAEVNRSAMRNLGINLAKGMAGSIVTASSLQTFIGGLTGLNADNTLAVSDSVNGLANVDVMGQKWTMFFDALKQNSLGRVLAEPTLVSLSGKKAEFLAGGEIPIPVPQGASGDATTIQYKQFGVSLEFLSTVMGDGIINIQVTPEVSELDYANAVKLNGYLVPALTTRRVDTTVELRPGQSFAIAGILKETMRGASSRMPILGDVPVLGALFSSKEFQKSETELVVIITPRLARPLAEGAVRLPGDKWTEPSDADLFLHGKLHGPAAEDLFGPTDPGKREK